MVDGQVRTDSEIASSKSFHFSPDGNRWSFLVERDGKYLAVVQDDKGVRRESKPYDRVFIIGFMPDGKRLACAVMEGNQAFVLLGDQELQRHDGRLANLLVSPDGKRVAYALTTGQKSCIVVDRQELPKCDSVGMPVFSPDGNALAYGAENGKTWRMVTHRNGQTRESKPHAQVGLPHFSPDGKHVAYFFMDKDGGGVGINDAEWTGGLPLSLNLPFAGNDTLPFVAYDDTGAASVELKVVPK